MERRVDNAISALCDGTKLMHEAELQAKDILIGVLKPIGEHGATVENVGHTEGEFVVLAEQNPCEFKPITLVRYNLIEDKLEVFVSEWEKENEIIDSAGEWVDFDDAHTDIHFLLDRVMENLEYADYYDEDDE